MSDVANGSIPLPVVVVVVDAVSSVDTRPFSDVMSVVLFWTVVTSDDCVFLTEVRSVVFCATVVVKDAIPFN
jgi:hypothetical protein